MEKSYALCRLTSSSVHVLEADGVRVRVQEVVVKVKNGVAVDGYISR